MLRLRFAPVFAAVPLTLGAQQSDLPARIDRVFARFDRSTPGCAVGLGRDGRPLYTQGYGSANLEYRIPLTDSSVMESGSVAKQFTAASLVLLQQDGKLSIDDDIRKYLPEVPDFGRTITIRNLLTHTSGLRDQWGLLGIEGRGPGTQVHSLATTLDLVVHQKMLNFPPGSQYLYSNTGYALAAIIIQRVSGQSLQAFTQERLFGPLGMTHTQWRDDYTRVVPNRATAYEPVAGGGYRQDMPFTNMVGNGGVLSTMSDLLKWNENLDRPSVGGPTFTSTLETRMQLTSGRTIPYALGLINGEYDGVREVSHSGSTAGYRTFLARYPEQHVSVAVWCSNASANPTSLAHQVVDLVLPKPTRAAVQAGAADVHLTAAELATFAGVYRDAHTEHVITLHGGGAGLTTTGATAFVPVGAARFRTGTSTAEFLKPGATRRFVLVSAGGDSSWYDQVTPAPAVVPTGDYVGRYVSDELDVQLDVIARDGKLFIHRRPDDTIELRPTYVDAFQGTGVGSIRFERDARGAIDGFSIYAGRVLDVRFRRTR